jgi:hypothetical protein
VGPSVGLNACGEEGNPFPLPGIEQRTIQLVISGFLKLIIDYNLVSLQNNFPAVST